MSRFPLGAALVPYGLPCIRELFRFLISLTNPLDRHNSEVMIHMGLQLLTVALESAPIANCQSLLGLVKEELCRHLFQVSLACANMGYGTEELDTNLGQTVYWNSVFGSLTDLSLQRSSLLYCSESSELHKGNGDAAKTKMLSHAIFFRPGLRRMKLIGMNWGITSCFDVIDFEVIMDASC